jgi:molybdate transport system ATP-binding protein
VEGNLAYARRRASHAASNGHDADLVERTGIGHLLGRGTGSLSGGERQRVAIARALAARPRLLLMDEPLSSLDHDSRGSFLAFLENLCESASIPVLYVSHSVDEVARLSARVVVLECGRVSAVLTRDEFLARRNPAK